MEKTGQCMCGAVVKIPKSQCLYQCKSCKRKGVFLCHLIPESLDPTLIRCKECKIAYSLFECPQCAGTGVIKEFKSGNVYGCLCGFTATFVTCNLCTAMLCLPPKSNCQNVVIECKQCNNVFKYRLCSACKECNYMKAEEIPSSIEKCFNQNCRNYGSGEVKANKQQDKQIHIQPYNWTNSNPMSKCKVCESSQATMINNTCFHVAACEKCVNLLSLNKCPICSAVGKYGKANLQ